MTDEENRLTRLRIASMRDQHAGLMSEVWDKIAVLTAKRAALDAMQETDTASSDFIKAQRDTLDRELETLESKLQRNLEEMKTIVATLESWQ